MKMEILLDHRSILENRQSTIFFGVRLRSEPAPTAAEPTAYTLIVDRNNPSDLILRLAENLIRHLPANAELAILSASDFEPIYSLGDVSDKQSLIALVRQIDLSVTENLSAAWPIACRELKNSKSRRRKILFLTHDSEANRLLSIPTAACAREKIQTSIFAARPKAGAALLEHLAQAGQGQFHKNFSQDELNAVTAAELGSLLRPIAQNVRLRLKPLDFCDEIEALGEHREHRADLEDSRVEFILRDFLAGEDRTVCFNLQVQPLPCIDGKPIATLENEPLVEMELHYDEVSAEAMISRTAKKTICVRAQSETAAHTRNDDNFERPSVAAPFPFGKGVD